jgi:predicted DNA-binding ribbon-helix-helix protein
LVQKLPRTERLLLTAYRLPAPPEDVAFHQLQAPLQLAFPHIPGDAAFMRTTVTIDDDLYVKVKQIAKESGHTLGQVISQLARQGLVGGDLSGTAKAKSPGDTGALAPVFRILVGAAMIPGNRTVVLLDEGK